jgi:hypothetical protein
MLLLAGCGFHPGALARDDGGTGPTADSGAPDADAGSLDAPDASSIDAGSAAACTLPPNVNVDPGTWAATFASAPIWSCTGSGTTTIDSDQDTITNGCTTGIDMTYTVMQAGGGMVLAIPLRGLSVTGSHVLKLVGDKPIVFLVAGDVVVDTGGVIDASASGAAPGPGAFDAASCGNGAGGASAGAGWGGGGAGFGTPGGDGGWNTENAGAMNGNATLTPLRGGCPGGTTSGSTSSGAGGGAFQISASGTISIGPTGSGILAAAGGGAPATMGGGNGGGAGGGILLVSPAAATFGAGGGARAHGGAGSSGNGGSGTNFAGTDGHTTDDTPATDTSGTAGTGSIGGNDDGRVGGLAHYGAGGLMTMPGALHPKTMNGRGGGGGGGGRIVVTMKAAGPSCD